jgi:hypothetical protein
LVTGSIAAVIPVPHVSIVTAPLFYKGERVITLAADNALHGRSAEATRVLFAEHKDQAPVAGRHYFEVPYVVWSQWVNETRSDRVSFLPDISGRGGRRGPLTVLNERGYLRLVMYFEDELAKDVCDTWSDAVCGSPHASQTNSASRIGRRRTSGRSVR